MSYYDTIEEDLKRAKQILVDGKNDMDPDTGIFNGAGRLLVAGGGTIYGKDLHAAYKLLESFVAEIERSASSRVPAPQTVYHHAVGGRSGCGAPLVRGNSMPELNHVTCEACKKAYHASRVPAPTEYEVCLGCGKPTATSDCGCPAGTGRRAMRSKPPFPPTLTALDAQLQSIIALIELRFSCGAARENASVKLMLCSILVELESMQRKDRANPLDK